MRAYTIVHFNSAAGLVTIKTKDRDNKFHEMTVPADGLMRQELGQGYIQDNFPDLTPAQREVLMTGINEDMWDTIFKDED